MADTPRKIWFPAKTYGFGWGLPTCWQGWVVLSIYAGLFWAGGRYILPRSDTFFLIYAVALGSSMMVILCLKGEKFGWRWGKD